MSSKYFKVKDPFYKPVPPVKTFRNRKSASWSVIDNGNIIIADNLTRNVAHSIAEALNYIDRTLFLLKGLWAMEDIVGYLSSCTPGDQNDRNMLVKYQRKLLKDLGRIKEGQQNYHGNLENYFYRLAQGQLDDKKNT